MFRITPALALRLVSVGVVLGTADLSAQVLPTVRPDTLPRVDTRGESEPPTPRTIVSERRTLLEGPVSRTDYLLGPGDVVTLSLVGYQSHVFTTEVAPEGTIVVPDVGVIPVGGLNLDDAERLATRRVRRFYSDVEVNLTLSGLRSFKVFLVGNVAEPGSREATAVTRVSEVVEPVNPEGVIHRNIAVRRTSGGSLSVDLARFLRTGDLAHNPTLREGDVIHVPPIDRTVSAIGRVAYPGVYEHRPSETLAEFLALVNGGGPFPADAADTLRLQRFVGGLESEVRLIPRSDALGPTGNGIAMQPFDALYVLRYGHYNERSTARVGGEVARPGDYPIVPNVTTVGDLVEMAGGLTGRASLYDALLRRRSQPIPGDSETQLQTIPPEMLSRDELRILQVTNRADEGSVVLDLGRLLTEEGSAYDIALEDGDLLHVPELRNEVTVMGAVTNPGIVAYEPGQAIDYFVHLAGGYADRADRGDVAVLRGKQGNRLGRRDVTTLVPGDRIVVPFKEPRTFFERVQTVEGIVSTLSGMVLAIVAIERIWN